jgi:hypothetical protein
VQDGILGELVRVVMGVELIEVGWALGEGGGLGRWGWCQYLILIFSLSSPSKF